MGTLECIHGLRNFRSGKWHGRLWRINVMFLVPVVCMVSVALMPQDPFANAHLREKDLRPMLVWKWGPKGPAGN